MRRIDDPAPPPLGNRSGFTLLEVLIVFAVLGLIMAAVYAVYLAGTKVFVSASELSDRQEQSRTALNLMIRDIRQLGYDPSGATASLGSTDACKTTPICTADTSTLEFIGDVTRDGVTDKVRYRLTGSNVTREIASWASGSSFPAYGASATIATSVAGLTFTYYDSASPNATITGLPLSQSNRQKITRIQIQITMTTGTGTPQQVVVTSNVRPRNLCC